MPLPTPITGVDHIAITITDAARSKEFYGTFLGLDEVPRPASFDFPGAWYRAGNMLIHLVGKPVADEISNRHFCLMVPDIKAAMSYCAAARLDLKKENHKISGIARFFIRDPDGNRIEFQGPDGAAQV